MREFKYDKILEAGTDGYWILDLKNPSYEYISPKYWTTLGLDPDQHAHSAEAWKPYIHPGDLKRAEEAIPPHLADPQVHPYNLLVRYKHALGHWVWIVCRGATFYDDEGDLDIMVGKHQDVTNIVNNKFPDAFIDMRESGEAMLVTVSKMLGVLDA